MEKTLAELSTHEFEDIVERAVDRRLEVWLTQLMDALLDSSGEDEATLNPQFAEALKESIDQANAGQGIGLHAFRAQLGR